MTEQLRNIYHGQIDHLEETVVCRKDRLGFGHFAELSVEAFNGVGGIDQPLHRLWVLEIGAETRPIL